MAGEMVLRELLLNLSLPAGRTITGPAVAERLTVTLMALRPLGTSEDIKAVDTKATSQPWVDSQTHTVRRSLLTASSNLLTVISNLPTVSSSPRTAISRRTVTEDITAEVTSLDLPLTAVTTTVNPPTAILSLKTPPTARLPMADRSSVTRGPLIILLMILVSEDQVDTVSKIRALTDQLTVLGRLSMETMAALPGTTSRLPLINTEDQDTVETMTAMALLGTRE